MSHQGVSRGTDSRRVPGTRSYIVFVWSGNTAPDPFVKQQHIANPRELLGLGVAWFVPTSSGQQTIWVQQGVGGCTRLVRRAISSSSPRGIHAWPLISELRAPASHQGELVAQSVNSWRTRLTSLCHLCRGAACSSGPTGGPVPRTEPLSPWVPWPQALW